jgi:hypothetical protein
MKKENENRAKMKRKEADLDASVRDQESIKILL